MGEMNRQVRAHPASETPSLPWQGRHPPMSLWHPVVFFLVGMASTDALLSPGCLFSGRAGIH